MMEHENIGFRLQSATRNQKFQGRLQEGIRTAVVTANCRRIVVVDKTVSRKFF